MKESEDGLKDDRKRLKEVLSSWELANKVLESPFYPDGFLVSFGHTTIFIKGSVEKVKWSRVFSCRQDSYIERILYSLGIAFEKDADLSPVSVDTVVEEILKSKLMTNALVETHSHSSIIFQSFPQAKVKLEIYTIGGRPAVSFYFEKVDELLNPVNVEVLRRAILAMILKLCPVEIIGKVVFIV